MHHRSAAPISGGFTLLEVVFALGLLATAIAGVGHLLLASAASAADARRADLASVLALERMEQLRGLAWGYDMDGVPREDHETALAAAPGTEGAGPGLGPSPADALEQDTPGFVDYLEAGGHPVDPQRSPAAVAYIRRWLVLPLADAPGEGLVLRVAVIRGEARAGRRPTESRGAVVLTTIKTRRTR